MGGGRKRLGKGRREEEIMEERERMREKQDRKGSERIILEKEVRKKAKEEKRERERGVGNMGW